MLLGSAMTIMEGLGYIVVAYAFGHRSLDGAARLAAILFQAWWYLIGANKILAAAVGLGAVYGALSASFYVAVTYFNVVVLCASLWCLLSFLGYLLTGRRAVFYWVGALYLVYYVLLTYHITAGVPVAVGEGQWRTYLVSQNPAPAWRTALVGAGLVVPQVIGAIAYATLVVRFRDLVTRARILLVSLSIIGWTVGIYLVTNPGFSSNAALQVMSRVVGVGSASLGLLAYSLRMHAGQGQPAPPPRHQA